MDKSEVIRQELRKIFKEEKCSVERLRHIHWYFYANMIGIIITCFVIFLLSSKLKCGKQIWYWLLILILSVVIGIFAYVGMLVGGQVCW